MIKSLSFIKKADMKLLKKYPNLKDFMAQNEENQKVPEFIDHLIKKINEHIKKGGKILILTLTKKSSEQLTNFLLEKGYKVFYLHSDINTVERWEIIKKLKTGQIDIIVGVNLLREGIDLPEVSFLAILDADKEGFLRSSTSLIQIIGRAARNPNSEVVLYADAWTESIIKSLWETYRRRKIQQEYNEKFGIKPLAAISSAKNLEPLKGENIEIQQFPSAKSGLKKLGRITKKEKNMILKQLKQELDLAIKEWKFEEAAVIRDQIKELEEN